MSTAPALPLLRPDLEIFSGPRESDGQPTYSLLDPTTGQYRQVGWAEGEILKRLDRPQDLKTLKEKLERETTLRPTPEELYAFCAQATAEQLTRSSAVGDAGRITQAYRQAHPGWLQWLCTRYLFIRIPLCHPDGWLTRALPWVAWVASPAAAGLWIILFLIGAFRLGQNLDLYLSAFPGLFSLEGAGLYIAAILLLKLIHEFSHAFVAKAYGVRVPAMGVALMVFAPVAWCDVTDAWRLANRKQRFWISAAGLCAELAIAGIALFLWGITAPGPLQNICVVLSSATLASTLIVNINPAMRFDGYYILSDLWGIDNLRERSFDMTRWFLWSRFLGLDVEAPEQDVSRRRLVLMCLYSLYAWLYRIGLYIGIAVIVYYKFTKVVGITLFAAEIYLFMVQPALRESRRVLAQKPGLRLNRRLGTTLGVAAVLLLWVTLPLPRRQSLGAVIKPDPETSQNLYTPVDGYIQNLQARRGAFYKKGAVLLAIRSETLETDHRILLEEQSLLEDRSKALLARGDGQREWREFQDLIRQTEARLASVMEQRAQCRLTTRVDGHLYDWNPQLRNGMYLRKGTLLGTIADLQKHRIHAYSTEEQVNRVALDSEVTYISNDGRTRLAGRLSTVAPVSREEGQERFLDASYYEWQVTPGIRQQQLALGQTGHIWVWTRPRSHLAEAIASVWRTLVRESGF